jgi:hypothetical protein
VINEIAIVVAQTHIAPSARKPIKYRINSNGDVIADSVVHPRRHRRALVPWGSWRRAWDRVLSFWDRVLSSAPVLRESWRDALVDHQNASIEKKVVKAARTTSRAGGASPACNCAVYRREECRENPRMPDTIRERSRALRRESTKLRDEKKELNIIFLKKRKTKLKFKQD